MSIGTIANIGKRLPNDVLVVITVLARHNIATAMYECEVTNFIKPLQG